MDIPFPNTLLLGHSELTGEGSLVGDLYKLATTLSDYQEHLSLLGPLHACMTVAELPEAADSLASSSIPFCDGALPVANKLSWALFVGV